MRGALGGHMLDGAIAQNAQIRAGKYRLPLAKEYGRKGIQRH